MDCNTVIEPAKSPSTEEPDENESNSDCDNDIITAATALNHTDNFFSFVASCKDADTGFTLLTQFSDWLHSQKTFQKQSKISDFFRK